MENSYQMSGSIAFHPNPNPNPKKKPPYGGFFERLVKRRPHRTASLRVLPALKDGTFIAGMEIR